MKKFILLSSIVSFLCIPVLVGSDNHKAEAPSHEGGQWEAYSCLGGECADERSIEDVLDYNKALVSVNERFNSVFTKVRKILANGTEKAQLIALQDLAYRLFSGIDATAVRTNSPHCTLLRMALLNERPDPTDVASALLRAYEALETTNKKSKGSSADKEFQSWAKVHGVAPETMIDIIHGGGRRYLNDFLQGQASSSAMEARGGGLFVSIKRYAQERDTSTPRTPLMFFDDLTYFTGSIPAHYLQLVNDNAYDAVILPEHVPFLVIENRRDFIIRDMDKIQRYISAEHILPIGEFKLKGISYKRFWDRVANAYRTERLWRFNKYLQPLLPPGMNVNY